MPAAQAAGVAATNRQFVWLCASDAATLLAGSTTTTALPVLVISARGGAPALAQLAAAVLLSQVAALGVGGVLGDKAPRQRLMMLADLLQGASALGLTAAFSANKPALNLVALLAAVRGAGLGIYIPASQGLLTQLVADGWLHKANSIRRTIASTAQITGALAGAWLAATVGPSTMAVVGLLCLLSAMGRLGLRGVKPIVSSGEDWFHAARNGVREVSQRRWLMQTVLAFAIVNAAFVGCISVLGPLRVISSLGGAGSWGVISAATAAGSVLGAVAAFAWRPQRPLQRSIFIASVIGIEPLALAMGNLPIVVLGAFVAGACLEMFGILWTSILQRSIPNEVQSRVFAFDALGSLALSPLGPVVASLAMANFGTEVTLVATGFVMFVACALLALLTRSEEPSTQQ